MDTTVTDPLIGRVLDGRYAVESRLARGGMASVYLATDTRLDRQVAVKVMHPALADDDEFVARFIREARAAARLSHHGVVAVFDQGTDGDTVFLVMEYVAGRTLRDVLRERGPLSPDQALSVLVAVLEALAAAHAAGLVHRDVKPENVLLSDDGRIKVADFGLARAVAASHSTTTSSVLIGTVAYLAPEQVQRGVADARADVYSAGVLLYELLTGRPPFEGDTPLAVAYRHVNERVPAPSQRRPELPPELDELVATATAQDPDDRPADAGQLLRRVREVRRRLGLRDSLPVLPVPAADTLRVERPPADRQRTLVVASPGGPDHPVDDLPPDAPPRRRRRRWPFVVALLVVLAAGAGVAGWWLAEGRYVDTPAVLDTTLAQATAKAKAAGLHLHEGAGVYSDTITAGHVASQDPGPGSRVRDGGTITVHLSKGVEKHPVPNVQGKTPQQAAAALAAVKLEVAGTRQDYSDTVPAGQVIGTDPPAGTVLEHGKAVTLVVSKGVQPVAVPSVSGQSTDAAESALTGAGLSIGSTSQAYSDTVPQGAVISTDPPAGQVVPKGTSVNLVVSRGPQLFKVPDVTGKSVDDAVRAIEQAGFKAQPVTVFPGGPKEVLRQKPGGGERKPHGTTITLYVF